MFMLLRMEFNLKCLHDDMGHATGFWEESFTDMKQDVMLPAKAMC
jgi:hypothetical protein